MTERPRVGGIGTSKFKSTAIRVRQPYNVGMYSLGLQLQYARCCSESDSESG